MIPLSALSGCILFAGMAAPDEIIVEGQRAGRLELTAEKNADSLIEIVAQPSLRLEPSPDLAASLGRLPGVAVDTERGANRFVQLRGIRPALNAVTIDGVLIGAADRFGGGRQAPIDLFSTRLTGELQVIKVPTPADEGMGIGGILNLVPLRGDRRVSEFDNDPWLRLRAATVPSTDDTTLEAAGYWQIAPQTSGRPWSVHVAGAAESANGKQGVFLQRNWSEQMGASLPDRLRYESERFTEDRYDFDSGFSFSPHTGHTIDLSVASGRTNDRLDLLRYEDELDDVLSVGDDEVDFEVQPLSRTQRTQTDRAATLLQLSGQHDFERLRASWGLSQSFVSLKERRRRWNFEAPTLSGAQTAVLDEDGFYSFRDRQPSDIAGYTFSPLLYQTNLLDVTDDRFTAKSDLDFDVGHGITLSVGGLWRRAMRRDDSTLVLERADGSGARTGRVFTAQTPLGATPIIDMDLTALDQDRRSGVIGLQLDALTSQIESTIEDFEVEETVSAGYAMARIERGPMTVVSGARVEHTEREASGMQLTPLGFIPVTNENSHTDILPMGAVTLRLRDWLVLRGSGGKRLARPEFEFVAPRAAVDLGARDATVLVTNPDLTSRTAVNSDLSLSVYPRPETAVTIGVFKKSIRNEIIPTLGIFQGDAISPALAAEGLSIDAALVGVETLFLTTIDNVERYTVEGIEFSVQTPLRPHPWFEDRLYLTGALTLIDETTLYEQIDREGLVTAPEQTDKTAALTLVYADERFSAFFGYRYQSGFLTNLTARPETDQFQSPSHDVDFSLSYAVSDGLSVRFDAQNLINEVATEYQGDNPAQINLAERPGRQFGLALRYQWR